MRVKPLSVGVRALIEDDKERILLIKHTYVPGWHFPGGGVEPGETAQSAVEREVHEEARVRITRPPELVGVYLNVRFSKRDHVLLFRSRDWEITENFVPTLEIADMKLFPRDNLPTDLSMGTAKRMDEIFNAKPPSLHW
ncbi:MAG: NUDIX domain-containing protein [Rhizobiaceae bacterium]